MDRGPFHDKIRALLTETIRNPTNRKIMWSLLIPAAIGGNELVGEMLWSLLIAAIGGNEWSLLIAAIGICCVGWCRGGLALSIAV